MGDQLLAQRILAATEVVEKQVDSHLERLNNLDEDDLEVIRRRRIEALRAASRLRQDQEQAGHGRCQEITDERDFFEAGKKSKLVVCHFYDQSTRRCELVDYAFQRLAPKYFGTRFIKINREKVKFLTDRLNIHQSPVLVAVQDGRTEHYLRKFDDVGTSETAMLAYVEKWLLNHNVVDAGDKIRDF